VIIESLTIKISDYFVFMQQMENWNKLRIKLNVETIFWSWKGLEGNGRVSQMKKEY